MTLPARSETVILCRPTTRDGVTDLDNLFLDSLRESWQQFVVAAPRFALALAVLAAFWIFGRLMARGLRALLDRSDLAEAHLGFFRRLVTWIFVLIGAAVALDIIGLSGAASGLLAGGGITAVVLGFAFREIGENFLAGFFLAFSRPFNLGDLIESNGLQGVVREISLRSTHIRSADGRDIYIPSSKIFKEPLINFTRDGLRRHNFSIGVAYSEDIDRVCGLLLRTVIESGYVLEKPGPFAGITNFQTAFVEVTVRVWVDAFNPPPDVSDSRSAIMSLCRRALVEAGYTLSSDVSQAIELVNKPPAS